MKERDYPAMRLNSSVTGKDVISRALLLMGYTNSYGEVDPSNDAALWRRATECVRQVYNDLQRAERRGDFDERLLQMDQPVPLSPETVRDVMPYGVAMFLAQSEGDCDSQALMAEMYNRKRVSVRKPRERIRNDVF